MSTYTLPNRALMLFSEDIWEKQPPVIRQMVLMRVKSDFYLPIELGFFDGCRWHLAREFGPMIKSAEVVGWITPEDAKEIIEMVHN